MLVVVIMFNEDMLKKKEYIEEVSIVDAVKKVLIIYNYSMSESCKKGVSLQSEYL